MSLRAVLRTPRGAGDRMTFQETLPYVFILNGDSERHQTRWGLFFSLLVVKDTKRNIHHFIAYH